MENRLWYKQPAENWNEALPVGNGQLGAMIFGGVRQERLVLNHDTLWSGRPHNTDEKDKTEAFYHCRAAALKGDYAAAQRIAEQSLCGRFDEGYLPLGDLMLRYPAQDPTHYTRTLRLDTATAVVEYESGGVQHRRVCFASFPGDLLAVHHAAEGGTVQVECTLNSPLHSRKTCENGLLLLRGVCPTHVEPPYVQSEEPVVYNSALPGVRFCCGVRPLTDGHISFSDGAFLIEGANWFTLLCMVETSFVDYKTPPDDPEWACAARVIARLLACTGSFEDLLRAHIRDYQELETRCTFALAPSPRTVLPTDERLRLFERDKHDFGLYELLLRYGRYLLISCSRPGTQPANLQGIWNREIRAPWSSNYTLNINTEMNYWPAFSGNLAECAQPLTKMAEELVQSGASAARSLYGAEGFAVHHNTDLWRAAGPVGAQQAGSACYGFWPLGGAWLCRAVWEYYEYTLDEKYLSSRAYPILKSAARFILDMLVPGKEGKLIFTPSTSPENNFLWRGEVVSVSRSTAMGQSIAKDLLQNCEKAALLVKDQPFARCVHRALKKLDAVRIGADGRLMEWHEEVPEPEKDHRHLSHLYGLYPATQISPVKTPELAEACRKSLMARGDAGTGWSLAWKVNLWARLGDGEHALSLLQRQLHFVPSDIETYFTSDQSGGQAINFGGTYPNFLCAHPPFQLDGSLGAAAGILEMLVQSDGETVTLLPALPQAWADGAATGIRVRGGACIDLEWHAHKLCKVAVTAYREIHLCVRLEALEQILSLRKGESRTLHF